MVERFSRYRADTIGHTWGGGGGGRGMRGYKIKKNFFFKKCRRGIKDLSPKSSQARKKPSLQPVSSYFLIFLHSSLLWLWFVFETNRPNPHPARWEKWKICFASKKKKKKVLLWRPFNFEFVLWSAHFSYLKSVWLILLQIDGHEPCTSNESVFFQSFRTISIISWIV